MNTGVISLLLLVSSFQIFLSTTDAQVPLDASLLAGGNVGNLGNFGLNFGGPSQLDMPQPQPSPAIGIGAGMGGIGGGLGGGLGGGIGGGIGLGQGYPGYFPGGYPSYPVIDDYPYYGNVGILGSIFRAIKYCIIKILMLPVRFLRFVKSVIYYILGIGSDYYNSPFYPSYPSGPFVGF